MIAAVLLLAGMPFALFAAYDATGTNLRLGNWVVNNGALEAPESDNLYMVAFASIGLPIIGVVQSVPRLINNVPTFDNKLLTGFLFVNWFETFNVDDNYDIVDLRAFRYPNGPELPQGAWANDADPYFTWRIKLPDVEVEGYSYAFDELPDHILDSVDPSYQAPEMYLSEGKHGFYVVAKSTGATWGNIGIFEIWVDTHEPTIDEILPADHTVVNTGEPTVQATVQDNLSGVDPDSITLQITTEHDTISVLPQYDPETGIVSYQPPEALPDGLITVFISVSDYAGNESVPLFWTFTIDTVSPTGSIVINNDAAATDSNKVTLTITALEQETAIEGMMLSNREDFEGATWEPFVALKENWFLEPTAGIKTVYVKFRDAGGNVSPVYSDSIVLTITSPNTFILSAPPSITQQTTASFSYTATEPGAVFYYKLDNGDWVGPETEPTAEFEDLATGNHYFQVKAGFDADSNGEIDPDEIDITPAVTSWTIGTLNPSTLFSERPIKYYRRE